MNSINQSTKFIELSDKYNHVNTTTIINKLQHFGWTVQKTVETKVRKQERQGYQKHFVTLVHDDLIIDDQNKLTLLIVNSHDGSSSLQFKSGIFRLVCSNGLIVGNSFLDYRIRHTAKNIDEELYYMLQRLRDSAVKLNLLIKKMQNTEPKNFIDLVKDEFYKGERVINLDKCQRYGDRGQDLYTIFNRAQENILKGNVFSLDKQRYKTKIRSIKSIIDVNQKLFNIAEQLVA